MTSERVIYQPYWDADENYAPLLDFARRCVPAPAPGFHAPTEPANQGRYVQLDVALPLVHVDLVSKQDVEEQGGPWIYFR